MKSLNSKAIGFIQHPRETRKHGRRADSRKNEVIELQRHVQVALRGVRQHEARQMRIRMDVVITTTAWTEQEEKVGVRIDSTQRDFRVA
jgi:hypothetical protein